MRVSGYRACLLGVLITWSTSAISQPSIDAKVQTIKDALVTLCLAGGSETAISAQGDLELRSKIRDLLTGHVGASAKGETQFSKKTWEGIVGGISKDMTAVQSQQATEARKCMVDNGFTLINKVLGN
jgi:hypothetical protein